MTSATCIKKIRRYSLIAFVIPILAMNACLLLYKFIGETNIYSDINYPNKERVTYSLDEFLITKALPDNIGNTSKTYGNCPKYNYNVMYEDSGGVIFKQLSNKNFLLVNDQIRDIDGSILPAEVNTLIPKKEIYKRYEIKKIILEPIINEPNDRCIKNRKILYFFINNFTFLDKILSNASENSSSGFSEIKNPYLYGEVSISRTARYFPANLIFKPLILISAFFLFLYWKSTFNLLNGLRDKNILKKFSSGFYIFGILSSISLAFHAIFLGIEFDSKVFTFLRRIIIILFISFEIIAQFILTKNLFANKKNLLGYIQPIILNIKIIFVVFIMLITLMLFLILYFMDLENNVKNILEWNYFAALLVYYFLSRLMWISKKL